MCIHCINSSSLTWLSRLTSGILFYFRATVWKFYLKMKWQSWMLWRAAGTACWRRGKSDRVFLAGLVAPPWTAKWLAKRFAGDLESCRQLELWRTDSVGKTLSCSIQNKKELFGVGNVVWVLEARLFLVMKKLCLKWVFLQISIFVCLVHCVFNRCWLCFNLFIYVYISINIYLDVDQPCPALMHWQRIWKSLLCFMSM